MREGGLRAVRREGREEVLTYADARGPALLAALLLAAGLSGCSAPEAPIATSEQHTISMAPQREGLPLGPHDRVIVSVANRPEFSTPGGGLTIDLDGYLHLPVTGPVLAKGKSLVELRALIEEKIRRYVKRPMISLSVAEYASQRVYVIGHVDDPGEHLLDRPLTAIQVLSIAGPFKSGADRSKIALLRRHEDGIEVHFLNAETPDADAFVMVQPDDLLVVRRSGAGRFNEVILPFINGTLGSTGGWANTTSALRTMDDL